MNPAASTRIRSSRKRTRFPGTAELERLLVLDIAVITALLVILVICHA